MFDRLQTRIVLLFAILFVVVQSLTSFAVYTATTTNINEQVSQQLIYSGKIVQQSLEKDVIDLAEGTRLLSSDFGFRTAVATNDYLTIKSALNNLVTRIDADSAVLISLEEIIISDTLNSSTDGTAKFNFPNLIETADIEGQAATFLSENGKLYEMVLMPVLAPIPVAWIGIRLEMDDEKAQSIKNILPQGIDISYAMRDENIENQWRLVASTLSGEYREQITTQIDTVNNNIAKTVPITLGGSEFLALPVNFPTRFQNMNVQAILQYSLDVAFSPYQPLILALAILIAVGLIALIAGSLFISRSVTHPISALAQSAKRISEGIYLPVNIGGRKDEVRQLASSFNLMIDGIKQREAKITHQAEHDLATGLPNRVGLEKHLNSIIKKHGEENKQFCVLEVSIDRFNDIRNALGFTTSENLVKEIGPRLNSLTKEGDFTARIYAATFIVVLPNVDVKEANKISQRIVKGFEPPFQLGAATIDVMVEIGIVSYPQHGTTAEDIILHSNIANFQSKGLLNKINVYDAEKDQKDADKLSLMSELRRAIDNNNGEIYFNYQPKIDLKLGKITNAEALIRWVHPERGFISPDDFIPLAERTGHIHNITLWALEAGIKQVSEWQKAGHDIKIAINLSARDLTNKELPGIIAAVLKMHKTDVGCLVLEVTESAVMEDPELALGVLHELNNMGLTLSIDDYGTGYSSMAYLKQLPVKEIKIDKSFILNLAENKDDEIIVRSTIELGHNLGLKVTAEGIEDEASLAILKKYDCDLAQGYFFAKPLAIDEFNNFLATSEFGINSNQ